jgi:hypothetical protein
MPRPLRRGLYERAKRLNVTDAARSPMPAETHERLRVMFAEETQQLSAFLDRDLTHWTRAMPTHTGAAMPGSARDGQDTLADGE